MKGGISTSEFWVSGGASAALATVLTGTYDWHVQAVAAGGIAAVCCVYAWARTTSKGGAA